MKRVVLGFSGSLASAAAIPWLRNEHGVEVITVTVDVGQGEELAAVRERALALGAVRAHVIDARDELIRGYLLPALQAGALVDGHALVNPLVAKRLVELARMESAPAIVHAARAGTVAHTVIHAAPSALGSALEVLAPAVSWTFDEAQLAAIVKAQGVHVLPRARWRIDASLWGRHIEARAGATIDEDALTLTRNAEDCPEYPAFVDVEFAAGVPIAANGVDMSMAELLESLETIAGAHGVGRSRARGVAFEMPAACVLGMAHAELEARVIGQDLTEMKRKLARIYSDALRHGRWFSDIRAAIDAWTRIIQPRLNGTVKLRLLKGQCAVVNCEIGRADAVTGPRAVA